MGEVAGTGLTGRVVLVTRPGGQGERLARMVQQAGGQAVLFPTLQIEPVAPSAEVAALLRHPAAFDLAVFVSANAVAHGLPLLGATGAWPSGRRAAAVGARTAEALREHGVPDVIAPGAGGDSMALLALEAMQRVSGQRVLIFRGVGGREVLAETLRARGADVRYVECYRRVKPAADPEPVRARIRQGELDAVTAASAESLANLLDLVGPAAAAQLLAVPLFVTHENIRLGAVRLGFRNVQVTVTSDAGLLEGMMAFFAAPARGRCG